MAFATASLRSQCTIAQRGRGRIDCADHTERDQRDDRFSAGCRVGVAHRDGRERLGETIAFVRTKAVTTAGPHPK